MADNKGYCSKCEFKSPTHRKFGVTYSCDKEVTNMDVTYHVNHETKCLLCPLLNQTKSSEESVWNFFKDKSLDHYTPAAFKGDLSMKSKKEKGGGHHAR